MLISGKVIEYDIYKCGPTCLLIAGVVDYKEYERLCKMDKVSYASYITVTLREIHKRNTGNDLLKVIADIRDSIVDEFIEMNKLSKNDIIDRNFDAVWVNKPVLLNHVMRNNRTIVFRNKREADISITLKCGIVYYNDIDASIFFRNFKKDTINDNMSFEFTMLCRSILSNSKPHIFKHCHNVFKLGYLNREERDTILLNY